MSKTKTKTQIKRKRTACTAPADNIAIGMIGEDYNGDFYRIYDYGTVKEMCKKYPFTPCGLSDFIENGCSEDDIAVIVFDGPRPIVYSYGEDGFWVNL